MALYMSRPSAIRAAKQAARIALGPYYEAAEGPDYIISPTRAPLEDWGKKARDRWNGLCDFGDRYRFELRGPAANPNDEEKALAEASWARYRAKKLEAARSRVEVHHGV